LALDEGTTSPVVLVVPLKADLGEDLDGVHVLARLLGYYVDLPPLLVVDLPVAVYHVQLAQTVRSEGCELRIRQYVRFGDVRERWLGYEFESLSQFGVEWGYLDDLGVRMGHLFLWHPLVDFDGRLKIVFGVELLGGGWAAVEHAAHVFGFSI
jgi:hypothetical protein